MNIATTDAQGLFTNKLIDVYKERVRPTSFLRSFFPDKVTPTLEVSIEVQRGFEKVATDVVRGTDGNLNRFTKSSEKIWIPPYFREGFEMTNLQLYDRLYGATSITDSVFASFINSVSDAIEDCQGKIERRYEIFCAQVLQTGILTLTSDTNIDFKRKAASMVDPTAGNYWANNVDPFDQIEAGCNFIRQKGKSMGGTFNLILGTTALADLLTNTVFTTRQNLFHLNLDAVIPAQRNSIGASLHGEITCGSYKVRLWSYPQFYDDANNVSQPYIDPKLVVLLPENPRFHMAFAAVPQLLKPGTMPKVGAYSFGEYIDERKKSHIMDVESAGMPIPVGIDQIYTLRAVAA